MCRVPVALVSLFVWERRVAIRALPLWGQVGRKNRCRYQPTAQTTLGNKQLRNDNEVIKAKTCSPFQPPAPMSSSKPGAETMFSDEQTGHQRATRDPQHRWELTRSPLAIMFG